MKNTRYMEKNKMVRRGIKALYRELGPVEAQRFISMTGSAKIDSVKKHREWQDTQEPEKLLKKVAALHDAHQVENRINKKT